MSHYGNPHHANTAYNGGVYPQTSRPMMQHDLPPPPPPIMPALPSGLPPSMDMYRFQGDSWRPGGGYYAQQQNEFSFRSNHNGPQYPHDTDYYTRPTRSNTYATNEQRQLHSEGIRGPGQDGYHGGKDDRRGHAPHRGRGHRPRPATADRPLLRFLRGTTPEQLLGMVEDQSGSKRFLPAEDLSDSAEEDMDESDSDQNEQSTTDGQTLLVSLKPADGEGEAASIEPPAKRQAREPTTGAQHEGARIPQWSNPDPYTVLPPPDEAQRKKRDVVKLIRKARIVSENMPSAQSQVATNDDFISFGFDDDLNLENEYNALSDNEEHHPRGVPGAPSGPRQFSHLQNLHGQISMNAPGVDGRFLSANSLGTPPGGDILVPDQPQGTSRHEWPLREVDATVDPVEPVPYAKILSPPNISMSNKSQGPVRDAWPPTDVNEALGTRKRTHDDVIKDEPSPPRQRVRNGTKVLKGKDQVLQEWTWNRKSIASATPWLIHDHKNTENQGFRLHKEICDFYDFVKPRAFEQTMREEVLGRLREIVKRRFPASDVHCFGSFAAGLYLPTADIDVVVVSDGYLKHGVPNVCQSRSQMYSFAKHLKIVAMAEHDFVEVIPKAKVPLIKFVDRITSLRVDISFENKTGLIANHTFGAWKQQFPAMPILVMVIKQFLMMRGLNEVVNGGLGGFSVTCLVTSLLQNMPRVQTGEMVPEHHLGELLMEFLDFYGNQLDIARAGILMEPPAYFDKRRSNGSTYKAYKSDRLAIMDPNRPENDISGGSRNVMLIFKHFAQARQEILEAMSDVKHISLLDCMLGGNYDSFTWQRMRLKELYRAKYGKLEINEPEPSAANHPSPDNKLYPNDILDFGSSVPSKAPAIDGSSSLHLQGVLANPFGPSQPPAKTRKEMAATAAKARPTSRQSLPVAKSKAKQHEKQKREHKPKNTAAVAEKVSQASKPPQPSVASASRKARARANKLKNEYPGMKDIPVTVSKKARTKLIADYNAQRMDAREKLVDPKKKPADQKKPIDAKKKPVNEKKKPVEPKIKPAKPKGTPKTQARRSQKVAAQPAATSAPGTSNRTPIEIN